MRVVGTIVGFVLLVLVTVLRVALGAVLAILTPIVMPFLAPLSRGGLLSRSVSRMPGYWNDVLKSALACALCSLAFIVVAGVAQLVDPFVFSAPISLSGPPEKS